jgi:hypothetical protein
LLAGANVVLDAGVRAVTGLESRNCALVFAVLVATSW